MEGTPTGGGHGEPTGPRLNVIGEVELVVPTAVGAKTVPGHQLSLVTFLRCCGPANRSTIVDALWDGRRISAQRVANLMAEARATLGREVFPDPVGGRYRIVGLDTDFDHLERLLTAASLAVIDGDVEPLTMAVSGACRLVRGVPFSTGGGSQWVWLDHRPGVFSQAESTVSSSIQQLADLAIEMDQPALAATALEAGLVGCPWDEGLVARLAEVYLTLRRPGLAGRLVDGWEVRVRRLGFGEPSSGPRDRLIAAAQAGSIGSAVTTKLPR